MANPALVEVVRGGRVESRHCGAVAVVDSNGKRVFGLGDVEQPVFPRSAVKALQALVLVETGAADRFGFGAEELALACASHGGEAGHVSVVTGMLARAGLDETALKCGAHWPLYQPAAQALARSGGTAKPLHNNCSGKHAGFLCAACVLDADRRNYFEPTHPVQREVKAVLENMASLKISDSDCAIDGCSVPTWAIPLASVARAFACFATGRGMSPIRSKAAQRLRAACVDKPWYTAGTGRFCTEIMTAFGPRVYVKSGAEGMCCAGLPEQGLGIAVKCDDGAGRAGEVMMAATLARVLNADADRAALEKFIRPALRNWNGTLVGEIRPTAAI
ncbi:MAG TPA: asparaginase [Xanthobacteraceae bacterium]|nr:asparaginase [Xanthobacteraceae bacterium]